MAAYSFSLQSKNKQIKTKKTRLYKNLENPKVN